MTKEEFLKRYNASYPHPLWDADLQFHYSFLEEHLDVPAAKKLYQLMKDQEVEYRGTVIVFFDSEEMGLAWTNMVWELGKELIAAMQEWEDKDDTIKK